MGLDMYLKAKQWLYEEKDKEKVKAIFPDIDLKVQCIEFEAIYWRKANSIHNWFVEHCQNGKDDCQTVYVDREKLEQLLKTVDEVLKDRNIEKAARILPPVSGFFFGSNQIDDYYWEDLEYTQKSLTDLLNNEKYKDLEFYYRASW